MDPRHDSIEFMQIDCDYMTEKVSNQNRMEGKYFLVNSSQNVIFIDEKEDTGNPVIRLFGVNAAGNSVCAHIHNFTAYFYIHVCEKNVNITNDDIERFRIYLNRQMHARDAVLEIEMVQKYPIMHY